MPIFNPTSKISQYYPWARSLLFPTEADGLKRYSKNRRFLVEIGVFEGSSACILKKHMHPEGVLWLIDPFIQDSMNSAIQARKWITKLNLYFTTPFSKKVIFIEKKSQDVPFCFPIDFLFIDGDHSIKGTFEDWEKYSPFLKSGGIVALHDSSDFSYHCEFAKGHPGPKKLKEYLESNPDAKKQYEFNKKMIDFKNIPKMYVNKVNKLFAKLFTKSKNDIEV